MPQNGTNNLIPIRTKEEAKARGTAGGKKSGEARRKKAAQKARLNTMLSIICKDPEKINRLQDYELIIDGQTVDNETLLDGTLISMALRGDLNAIKYIDERIGKNPQLELKRQIFEKDAEIKRLNAELAQRKHNVNRQRLKGEYDVDLESGLIEDSNDDDEGGFE